MKIFCIFSFVRRLRRRMFSIRFMHSLHADIHNSDRKPFLFDLLQASIIQVIRVIFALKILRVDPCRIKQHLLIDRYFFLRCCRLDSRPHSLIYIAYGFWERIPSSSPFLTASCCLLVASTPTIATLFSLLFLFTSRNISETFALVQNTPSSAGYFSRTSFMAAFISSTWSE